MCPSERPRHSRAEHNLILRFRERHARHYFCKTCGIYTFHPKSVSFDPAGIPVRATVGADMP
jgi:hypothetical protein